MKKIFTAILIASSLISCEDSFLKETPYNKVTQGNYYTTFEGVTGGVNGLYARLRYVYNSEPFMNICENGTDLNIFPDMTARPPVDPTTGYVRDFWNVCYVNINQCNEVIEALEEFEIPNLSDNLRKRYLAEARFIRAHYYDHLVKQFGDIHFQLKPTRGIATKAYRTKAEIVWNQIIEDLRYAVENLPEYYPDPSANYGRITKYAAMHNLSKVLLTCRRDDLSSLSEAQSLAETIINSGKYALEDSYALWDINNTRNKEVIFSVNFSKDPILNGAGNQSHMYFVSGYSEQHGGVKRVLEYGRGWVRVKPTRYAYELFLNPGVDRPGVNRLIDKRAKDWFITEWNVTELKFNERLFDPNTKRDKTVSLVKGDLAMIAPFWYNSTDFSEYVKMMWPVWVWLPDHMESKVKAEGIQSSANPNGKWPSNVRFCKVLMYPYLRKHLDPTRSDLNKAEGSRDVFVYRLAETYLLAAEAAFLQGNNETAAKHINVVRKRSERQDADFVGKMMIDASQVTADFILDERGRELIGEMHRWYDLIRFGKMTERMVDPESRIYYQKPSYTFEKYLELRPIPRDQILNMTNPEDFPNNPGYYN